MDYRKIYEDHNGPIPSDDSGRTYEIHHINGNRLDNSIDNLLCVSITDHYQIHFKQGDWAACSAIALRMKLSPSELSAKLSRLAIDNNAEKIENGTHHFQRKGKDHHSYDSTVYAFENISTGEVVNTTCYEFSKLLNSKHVYGMAKGKNKLKTVKGWKLLETEIPGNTIYKFNNIETGEIFEGTGYEFRIKYNLNQGNVSSMIKHKNTTVKNWAMLNT